MQLNANRLALAGLLVTALTWTACALFVALIPNGAMRTTEAMVHADLGAMAWHLTLRTYLIGLVAWSAFAGAFAWMLGYAYNHLGATLADGT